jgi:hypothetical protein
MFVAWVALTWFPGALAGTILLWLSSTTKAFHLAVLVLPIFTIVATSLGQERLLMTWLPRIERWEWVVPTALGATIGWLISLVLIFTGFVLAIDGVVPLEIMELLSGASLGVMLGLFQTSMLRRYSAEAHSRGSVRPIWVLGNTLAWAIGFALYRFIVGTFSELDVTPASALAVIHIEGWLLNMLVVAVLTGIALLVVLGPRTRIGLLSH